MNNNQLKALTIKACLVKKIINNEPIIFEELIEFLQLEKNIGIVKNLDSFFNLCHSILRNNKVIVPADLKEHYHDLFLKLSDNQKELAKFYYDYLFLMLDIENLDNDVEKFNALLELNLDKRYFGGNNETRKNYIYNLLSLALCMESIDLVLINELSDELQTFIK